MDSWVVGRFAGLPPNPIISGANFRAGGSGRTSNWRKWYRRPTVSDELRETFLTTFLQGTSPFIHAAMHHP
jgi:hypothetical protein